MSGDYTNGSRYLDDERLAKLFQNEDFLNELRHDQDFLKTLHSGLTLYFFSSYIKINI